MPELLIFLFHWFSLKWTNKSLSTFKAECIESVLTWSQTENLFSLVFIKIAVKKITTITAVLSTLATLKIFEYIYVVGNVRFLSKNYTIFDFYGKSTLWKIWCYSVFHLFLNIDELKNHSSLESLYT